MHRATALLLLARQGLCRHRRCLWARCSLQLHLHWGRQQGLGLPVLRKGARVHHASAAVGWRLSGTGRGAGNALNLAVGGPQMKLRGVHHARAVVGWRLSRRGRVPGNANDSAVSEPLKGLGMRVNECIAPTVS